MSDTGTGSTSGAGYDEGTTSATGEIKEAASDVVEAAQDVVASATETVQQTASAVVDTAQQATSAVTGVVADKVGQVSDAAAGKVEQLADTVAQTAYSADVSTGTRQVASTTVNVLDRTAEYLRDGDLGVVVEDLRSVVQRHPLRSLVIGLGLGYLARSMFFPASSSSTQEPTSGPSGGAPYTPTFQEVPVYREESYDSMSQDYALATDTIPPMGDTTLGLGSAAMIDDTFTAGSGVDTLAMESMSVGDDALGIESISMDDTVGTSTLGMTDGDTLGLGSDETSATLGGSTVDMMDTSDVGSLGIGGDNELLGSGAMTGTESFDAAEGDFTVGSDTPMSGSSDEDSSTTTTMPGDDLLRQWDDSTSGSGRS